MRACVRACVCACVRACVRAYMRYGVCVYVHACDYQHKQNGPIIYIYHDHPCTQGVSSCESGAQPQVPVFQVGHQFLFNQY